MAFDDDVVCHLERDGKVFHTAIAHATSPEPPGCLEPTASLTKSLSGDHGPETSGHVADNAPALSPSSFSPLLRPASIQSLVWTAREAAQGINSDSVGASSAQEAASLLSSTTACMNLRFSQCSLQVARKPM